MKSYAYLGGFKGIMVLDDMRIMFDTRDIGLVNVLTSGPGYEADVTAALTELLSEGACFIDVGANVGIHTIKAARLLKGKGQIFSFEPNANLFPILKDNVVLNGASGITTLHQAAVYKENGRLEFSYETGQHRVGALRIEGAVNYGDQTYEVVVVRLDEFVNHINPQTPVVIKIDVEGREAGVLYGAEKLLSHIKDVSLIMEYHKSVMESTGDQVKSLFDYLSAQSFRPFRIVANRLVESSFSDLLGFNGHTNLVLKRV